MKACGCSSSRSASASSLAGAKNRRPLVAHRHGLVVVQRLEPRDRVGAACREKIRVAAAELQHPPRRRDDRLIAGTAAEVARERVVDALGAERRVAVVGLGIALVEREQRHHEARRAEAALRGVALDHRLLHDMRSAVLVLQILDREQLRAVELADEQDAGVDRLVAHATALQAADRDRAGAAVTLGAAFLGAHAALHQAQVVEHRHGRIDPLELPQLLPHQKSYAPPHLPLPVTRRISDANQLPR